MNNFKLTFHALGTILFPARHLAVRCPPQENRLSLQLEQNFRGLLKYHHDAKIFQILNKTKNTSTAAVGRYFLIGCRVPVENQPTQN